MPTGGVPFIFDASTSMINRGAIRRADKLGLKIPYGVALNKKGKITTNAKEALRGTQLPIAGFKGSGLAWMVDILSGVFTGSKPWRKNKRIHLMIFQGLRIWVIYLLLLIQKFLLEA